MGMEHRSPLPLEKRASSLREVSGYFFRATYADDRGAAPRNAVTR